VPVGRELHPADIYRVEVFIEGYARLAARCGVLGEAEHDTVGDEKCNEDKSIQALKCRTM
jgi:hypothetical protein